MGSRRAELDFGKEPLEGHWERPQPWKQTSQSGWAWDEKSGKAEGVARTHQAAERFLQLNSALFSLHKLLVLVSFLSPTMQNFLLENKFAGNQGHCFIGISQFIPCRSDNPVFVISNPMQCHKWNYGKHLDPMNPHRTKALFSCRSVQ